MPVTKRNVGSGRGNRGIMNKVLAWRKEGRTEQYIRKALKQDGYKNSRVTQLIVQTRDKTAEDNTDEEASSAEDKEK